MIAYEIRNLKSLCHVSEAPTSPLMVQEQKFRKSFRFFMHCLVNIMISDIIIIITVNIVVYATFYFSSVFYMSQRDVPSKDKTQTRS